ncbi:MAG: hypothetical protein Q9208_007499 [Pyrenodesmia sp. 3 TL-2023]
MRNGRSQVPTENDDFQAALGQIERLLQTRKNLIYSDGPVADLDAIIADHLQDLILEEQSDLEIDRVHALSTLSWIQHKMIDQHFDTSDVDQLINRMIQQMREARGIQIAAPVLHDWSIRVALFGTLGRCVTCAAPYCSPRLVFSSDTARFELYNLSQSYYKNLNKIYGFETSQITNVSWSERTHRVMIRCKEGEVQSRTIFIDMMRERDVVDFFDMLFSDGYGRRIKCISK